MPQEILRCMETLICRLRLGAPYSHAFLFKIHKGPSPLCQECGEVENVLELQQVKSQRHTAQLQLDQLDNRPMTLKKILNPWTMPRDQNRAITCLCTYFWTWQWH